MISEIKSSIFSTNFSTFSTTPTKVVNLYKKIQQTTNPIKQYSSSNSNSNLDFKVELSKKISEQDFYKSLNLNNLNNSEISEDSLNKVYKDFAKKYHPDTLITQDLKTLGEERFREIQTIYNDFKSKISTQASDIQETSFIGKVLNYSDKFLNSIEKNVTNYYDWMLKSYFTSQENSSNNKEQYIPNTVIGGKINLFV